MRRALVTGAAGFVGRHVVAALVDRGWSVRAAVRDAAAAGRLPSGVEARIAGDLAASPAWETLVEGVDAVVHLAARAHKCDDRGLDRESEYRRLNVDATRALAAAAAAAGARRFVFMSSVKALGEVTPPGQVWSESSPCAPEDAYGRSKREAEQALEALASERGLGVVILRPPLVYGPGVTANMGRLLKAVLRGMPLPLGSVRNARSFVYVGNLVDAVVLSLEHSAAEGHTFHVSDGEDLSTAELIRRFALAAGRPARLLPCPPALLSAAAVVMGRPAEARRLLGSLTIDAGKAVRVLGWRPPYTVDDGLKATAAWLEGA